MAASVRMDDEAFSDERYEVLATACQLADSDHARGKMARLWRQCTARASYILPESVIVAVLGDNGVNGLLESQLGEACAGGVRICGTRGRIEWLQKLKESASKGGHARAAKWQTDGMPTGSQDGANCQPPPSPPTPIPFPTKEEREVAQGDRALATILILKVIANNPRSTIAKQSPAKKSETIEKWADHVRKMREIDGHTEADIRAVLEWSQKDEFWKSNVQSTETLRKQWNKLTAQMARSGSSITQTKASKYEQPTLTFTIGDVEVER